MVNKEELAATHYDEYISTLRQVIKMQDKKK